MFLIAVFTLKHFLQTAQGFPPMPANKHLVKDVLEDKSLVNPEVLESPQVARRYAKGIVLCQQIGFSKGSYANLRQLKHFYTQLYGGKSPSYSLIIRRALDLLNQKISMIKTHNALFEEQHLFSILSSVGKRTHGEL